jgi:tripartite-type tricarboxylate transporter receptor subunit TctC
MNRIAAALVTLAIPAIALAQATWPQQTVKVVVPYSPGGTSDFSARIVSQKIGENLGKSFIVENKTGASGTIGAQMVAMSAPDGYTVLGNDSSYAMLPSLFVKLPFDFANGLVPVTTTVLAPVVLVVPANSPFRTMKELVDFAKKNPGKLNYGSGGVGSSTHLNAEMFLKEAGVNLTHIPYKGAGEAMAAVLSGTVDMLATATPTAMGQLKGGKARALALSGPRRLAALPDVPTFAETGLPGYTVTSWFGFSVPKGTSKEIIAKLHAETVKALSDPAVKERIAQQGGEPGGMAPEAFAAFIAEDTRRWGELARAAGIKPE